MGDVSADRLGMEPEDKTVDLVSLGAVWSKRMNANTWTDRHGRETPVADLKSDHRLNVMGYLRRHCARLQHVISLYELTTVDVADDAFLEAPETPLQWLYGTPLYRALVAAVTYDR